ncbi:MAG: hypothetical protein B7Z35_07130 [Hydrogenophilales bacterium 12-61-10]|nr:MAG: hypothetical protein B7Z35_07130 [Hydrogenophilales bacterium 12-61-10]OYX32589.1 MAG: hypothetical protein B7Z03_01680 [Hydrogenophilales bacterium 32-62-9]
MPLPLPAAESPPAALERLFFTPAQRADLQAARARSVSSANPAGSVEPAPTVVKFDGVLIRSDGKTTRWVDGKAQIGTAGISNMKPGQIRANGKLYEPYQVQRTQPDTDNKKEPTP